MSALRDTREIVREEPAMHSRILEALAAGPLTVPQLAQALDCPTHEVLIWVMGMRRYGHLREVPGGSEEGFFRYEAIGKEVSR
jgi:hypothetical protein